MIYNIDWGQRTLYGYTRESAAHAKQKAGRTVRSCAEQESLIHDWADGVGQRVKHVYSDDVSASDYGTRAREQWEDLMEELAAARPHSAALVCFAVSRMSRDMAVWAPLVVMCRDRGVLIVVDGKVYDPTNSNDEFSLIILFAVATKQSRDTSENVQRAINKDAVKGRPHGRRVYGLDRLYDPKTGELVEQFPHPDQAPVVRRIFDVLATGAGPSACATRLNRDGITSSTGARWSKTTITNMARNKAYIGIRRHKGQESAATWKPIVEQETFWRVQRLLSDRARPVPRAVTTTYMLSSVMGCFACKYKSRTSKRVYGRAYVCPEGHYLVRADDVEPWVTEVLLAYLRNPRNFDRFNARDDRAAAEASAALEMALAERAELETLVDKGEVRPALAAQMDNALQGRIDAARAEVASVTLPPVLRGLVGPQVARRWERMETSQRRLVVASTLDIRVRPAGRGRHVVPVQDRVVIVPKFA